MEQITITINRWRDATDKAINNLQKSICAADIKAGKTQNPNDHMIVTALGINICAELEKELFKTE